MTDLMDEQDYHVQDDIKCCATCTHHDTIIDVMGAKELVCGLYEGWDIEALGLCQQFEWGD
uniref:Uncharacterized protein n=1 Tax=viral metagenome TaxID=1070528 RepID=A0A6M3LG16_9ZZZZ